MKYLQLYSILFFGFLIVGDLALVSVVVFQNLFFLAALVGCVIGCYGSLRMSGIAKLEKL